MENDDELLTEAQVAEMTGLSKRTLQSWRYRGGGPPFTKLGRAVRYRESELANWLDERTVESTAEHSTKKGDDDQ